MTITKTKMAADPGKQRISQRFKSLLKVYHLLNTCMYRALYKALSLLTTTLRDEVPSAPFYRRGHRLREVQWLHSSTTANPRKGENWPVLSKPPSFQVALLC